MPQGRTIRQDDETEEQIKVAAKKRLNNDMFSALTDENGVLPAGALPAVKAASEAGQKALREALDDENKVTAKPKRRAKPKEDENAEEVTPKTPMESGPPRNQGD